MNALDEIVVPTEQELFEAVFGADYDPMDDDSSRSILSPTNDFVRHINSTILEKIDPGAYKYSVLSSDTVNPQDSYIMIRLYLNQQQIRLCRIRRDCGTRRRATTRFIGSSSRLVHHSSFSLP